MDNVTSLKERLKVAETRAADNDNISREQLTQALASTVNSSLGDRVTGQIERIFDGVISNQRKLSELHSKSVNQLAQLVVQSHTELSSSLNGIRGDGQALPDIIKALPDNTKAIKAIADALNNLPKEFPEQKETDLTELRDLLLAALEIKPIDFGPELKDIKTAVGKRAKKFTFSFTRDEDDRIKSPITVIAE